MDILNISLVFKIVSEIIKPTEGGCVTLLQQAISHHGGGIKIPFVE